MPKQQYLQPRGGVYYYRRRVPPDLVKHFNGQKEISIALKTSDYKLACNLIRVQAVKDDATFAKLRRQHPKPANPIISNLELQYLAMEHFRKLEEAAAENTVNFAFEAHEEDRQEAIANVEGDIAYNWGDPQAMTSFRKKAKNLLQENQYDPEQNKEKAELLAILVKRAHIEHANRSRSRLAEFQDARFDSLYKSIDAQSEPIVHKPKIFLSQYIATYIKAAETGGLSGQVIRLRTTALNLFFELLGEDIPVENVSTEDCVRFADIICKLPRRSKKTLDKLKITKPTIEERIQAAKTHNLPLLSQKTKRNYIHTLSAFFKTAMEHTHIDLRKNPVPSGLAGKKQKRDRDLRQPFSIEQLNKIFKAPLYTGCKDDEFGYSKPGNKVIKRGRFWIPLLGLYTGMRLNELCQLYVEDIQNMDGVDVILVQVDDENSEKRIKSLAGTRMIPIHPALKKCGFMEYVKSMLGKHQRLFPELEANADGYFSGSYSKWFGRFLKATEAKTEKTNFHSFRHSFRDALKYARVQTENINELCGWEGTSEGEKTYGGKPKPVFLFEEISRVSYDGLDLSHLCKPPRARRAIKG